MARDSGASAGRPSWTDIMIDMPIRMVIADDQDNVRGAFRLILDSSTPSRT
jgi:hypothetical protein